ncbi:DNA-binding protein [bacterium]|nr:DNA-binding protein [bacterium]
MYTARTGQIVAVRLEIEENVHAAILKACRQHDIHGGFIVSGIGMLEDPEIGYYIEKGNYDSRRFTGRFECVSLCGNVSEKFGELMAHLHAMCANDDFGVFGGHLIDAKVGVTLELMIHIVGEPVKMYRELEADTGLPGLLIE